MRRLSIAAHCCVAMRVQYSNHFDNYLQKGAVAVSAASLGSTGWCTIHDYHFPRHTTRQNRRYCT